MKIKDVFYFNSNHGSLQRISLGELNPLFRRGMNKFFRAVEQEKLFISFFFGKHYFPANDTSPHFVNENVHIQFTTFVGCLRFQIPPSKDFSSVNTRIFRKICQFLHSVPQPLGNIHLSHWPAFWSLNLTAV